MWGQRNSTNLDMHTVRVLADPTRQPSACPGRWPTQSTWETAYPGSASMATPIHCHNSQREASRSPSTPKGYGSLLSSLSVFGSTALPCCHLNCPHCSSLPQPHSAAQCAQCHLPAECSHFWGNLPASGSCSHVSIPLHHIFPPPSFLPSSPPPLPSFSSPVLLRISPSLFRLPSTLGIVLHKHCTKGRRSDLCCCIIGLELSVPRYRHRHIITC